MFLATWKDIPNENETQFQIKDCSLSAGEVQTLQKDPAPLVTSSSQLAQRGLRGGRSSFPLCPPGVCLPLGSCRSSAASEGLCPVRPSLPPGLVAVPTHASALAQRS